MKTIRIPARRLLVVMVLLILLPIITLILNCNIFFVLTFLIWCLLVEYAYSDLENKSLLFAFLMMFFLFLMGREFLEQFFAYKLEDFGDDAEYHACFSMFLSLLTIGTFYPLLFHKEKINNYIEPNCLDVLAIRKISKSIYYITALFSILINFLIARLVFIYGYTELYVGIRAQLDNNIILFSLSKVALGMPVALSVFLATLPTKREMKIPLLIYIFNLFITLGQGHRSGLMLGIMFLFIYFIYRQGMNPEELWFKKKWIIYVLFFVPILAIIFSWYNLYRFGEIDNHYQWYTGIFEFFYAQGVTSNVLKHAYNFYNELTEQSFYVLEFAKSGTIGRLLGLTVYQGNSVEHALYGGSFTHALGYKVLGPIYLSGRGTGTSYIAELYQDFLYFGIILGNILYAYLLVNITKIGKKSVFLTSVGFLMINQLLWAPRGSFSGFISVLFFPSTIITLAIIFGINYLIKLNKNTLVVNQKLRKIKKVSN